MFRVDVVRLGMIMLALNAQFAPVAFAQHKPDCNPAPEVVRLGSIQKSFFDSVDWGNYEICDDIALFTNEEVQGINEDHYIFANRNDNDSFVFTVSQFVPISDWSKYGLNKNLVSELIKINAKAAIIIGTANETIPFTAITFSMNHPTFNKIRYHGMVLIDYSDVQHPEQREIYCEELPGHEGEYQRCKELAESKFYECNSKAKHNFHNSIANQAGLGAGVGGILGCIAGKMATAGPASAAAWKLIVAWCAVGTIVGILIALWQAWNTYQTDLLNCGTSLYWDLFRCQITHCKKVPNP